MQLKIVIDRETAASPGAVAWEETDPRKIADIVRDVAEDLSDGIPAGDITDGNGNKLGSYIVVD